MIALICIAIIIFFIFHYKNPETGNTSINQSEDQIVQSILNISSYQAKMEVEIQSNKNTNRYVVKQEVTKEGIATQEVLEPENTAGIVTKYENGKLSINHTKLNLSTVYENYRYMVDNSLWLDSFIEDYKKYSQATKQIVEGNEIILEVKNEENNKFSVYKKLSIDKQTGKPTKLMVQDINQSTLVYILYTEMKIS